MLNILAIIPARAGSKRIQGKNVKHFLGKEIIRYPIETLLSISHMNSVIVSTDSHEIKSIAIESGASVPFMRSAKNSDDYATTYDVIEEVLNQQTEQYDYVCCVYPTSVFVTSKMLSQAILTLSETPEATSIASVIEYSHPIQRSLMNKQGFLVSNHPECYNTRSQDLESNFHDAGQFYIFKPQTIKHEKKLITKACIPFILNQNYAQDIDTLDDWQLAELKYELMQLKKI